MEQLIYRNPLKERLRRLAAQLKKNRVDLKLLTKDHSTGDWDFSDTNWDLDSSIYVSAPSSLRFKYVGAYTDCFIKTIVVPIANVKEGRIITQVYLTNTASITMYLLIVFRYQDADNYYFIYIRGAGVADKVDLYIKRRYGGAETSLAGADDIAFPSATWRKLRLTWWNDYVGLVIRLEYWDGSQWVQYYEAYDANNYWKDTGGRVGFRGQCGVSVYYVQLDDTEIYGIPP